MFSLASSHFTFVINERTAYVVFGLVFVVSSAILHENSPNDMRAMQANLNIVLIVERHVGKNGDHGAEQVGVIPIHI